MLELNEAERRALVSAAILVGIGTMVRVGCMPDPARIGWHPRPGSSPQAIGAQLDSVTAEIDREERAAVPLGPGEKLDPNRAPEPELRRLPGVGPVRARAIVEGRRRGAYRTPADLERVAGIGPATAQKLSRHLLFPTGGSGGSTRSGRPETFGNPNRPGSRESVGPLDLNDAEEEELVALPWVGPVLARRILATRRRLGGFRSVDELVEVPGVGPWTLERLRPYLRVNP